jgi:hypothetical protein
MDELIIDEKKYISSKQAAKITGYAKDYIGQLCREGRVPARLVGRSWYVLESAMQDHRFGTVNTEQNHEVRATPDAPALPWTKQTPHYEAPESEDIPILPTLLRSKSSDASPHETEEETIAEAPDTLQNSWRVWFDRVGETIESVMPVTAPESKFEPQEHEEATANDQRAPEEYKYEDKEVNIPIHTIYQPVIQELVPSIEKEEPVQPERNFKENRTYSPRQHRVVVVTKIVAIIMVVLAVALATIGSGYLDQIAVSSRQVMFMSGITVYNK